MHYTNGVKETILMNGEILRLYLYKAQFEINKTVI